MNMNSTSAQFVTSRRMGAYEPIHQMSMWEENFKSNGNLIAPAPIIVEEDVKLNDQSEDASNGILGPSDRYYQEATNKPPDKVQRRLAQNREAARKSRLRKKAYVQQLETSRLKLIQLEQELERARKQGLYVGGAGLDANHLGFSGTASTGMKLSHLHVHYNNCQLTTFMLEILEVENVAVRLISIFTSKTKIFLIIQHKNIRCVTCEAVRLHGIAAFEMEYGHWVEEQNRLICELRTALHAHISDVELRMLVDSSMSHYFELFRMKATAAKADVFYVMSGMWKTSAERFFLWIGGFRPSELLKVLGPHLEPLTDQQLLDVYNLRQSCQQAEDALSQGMEKLQQTLAESVAAGQLGEGSYIPQMGTAMEKLEALVSFLNQADHLRQETLQQMSRILTIRQAARGLLAMGEYFQRLWALSSLWATRPREPA